MRIALVTASEMPVPDPESHLLVEALAARGADAAMVPWDSDYDWAAADLVVVRTPWDYVDRLSAFLAWADATAAVTRIVNPPAVLRWSTHKRYLVDLARRRVPVVPSLLIEQGPRALPLAWLATAGSEVVVKPAVSSGAVGALRGRADDAALVTHLLRLTAAGDAIVQPFVPSVLDAGEVSLMFASGVLSHAVRKIPAAGDYRIHEYYGGTVLEHTATAAELQVAEAALAAAPAACAYGRVDLLATPAGPVVIELELVEPVLFLERDGAADRFAEAFLALV